MTDHAAPTTERLMRRPMPVEAQAKGEMDSRKAPTCVGDCSSGDVLRDEEEEGVGGMGIDVHRMLHLRLGKAYLFPTLVSLLSLRCCLVEVEVGSYTVQ